LADDSKREIYDKYGSFGLHIADQFGDDFVRKYMIFSSKWFQALIIGCFVVSGCGCGCCCGCLCCCNFCCGKCAPDMSEEDDELPDLGEFEQVRNF
jgi:DnaJ family protein C protein 5